MVENNHATYIKYHPQTTTLLSQLTGMKCGYWRSHMTSFKNTKKCCFASIIKSQEKEFPIFPVQAYNIDAL